MPSTPRRPLGRQRKVLQDIEDHEISNQSQQAETDHHKDSQTTKDQSAGHSDWGIVKRSKKCK